MVALHTLVVPPRPDRRRDEGALREQRALDGVAGASRQAQQVVSVRPGALAAAARLDAAEVPHSPAHGYTGVYTLQVLFSAIQSSTCSLHAVECGRSLCASLPSEVA